MNGMLHIGQPAFEPFLAKEAGSSVERGPGWVLSEKSITDLCFAHLSLVRPVELKGETVNAMAGALADYFLQSSREERYETVWPLCFEAAGVEGLNKRAKSVEDAFREKTSRMARVMKLAEKGRPPLGPSHGLFVYFTDFGRAFAARDAWGGGQRRMADDAQAPSRSFLKVEEAYAVLREAPKEGETVVDLGAAPGGWSYSAARRGARVLAIDNGPLKGGALGNPLISARPEDAFKFIPAERADWLFCDMIEDPQRVFDLLRHWVEERWCGKFIVNLKYGRHDPLPLIREVLSGKGGVAPLCSVLRVRHLFHDREELTVVGILKD
ncbi:MAG: SAM-dependent methyltransferase [Elusimicrobiota bacterium]